MPVNGVGGFPSHDPTGELTGRAARRRAYEAQQRGAGRPVPGVSGGTRNVQQPNQQPGYRHHPTGALVEESTYRRPQEGVSPRERAAPERATRDGGVDPEEARRARNEFLQGMREARERRGAPRQADRAQAEPPEDGDRRAEGDKRDAGRARRAGGAGGGAGAGRPGIDPNTGMINRSRTRAAAARTQQMAAGSPQITGEDLEKMNRETNAEARQHHEAQQLSARQSGRMMHGPMIPSYGTHQSPHGRGHEYVG